MNSEPYRIHVAIYPSLKAIDVLGMGKLKVNYILGNFSKNIGVLQIKPHSRFVLSAYAKQVKSVIVNWRAAKDRDFKGLPTVHEILTDLQVNEGIPDVSINEISFILETVEWNNYTMSNETRYREWRFSPMTFRPTVWRRLKASDFPCKKIYEKYLNIKRRLKEKLGTEAFKRWKDVFLMNSPTLNKDLSNNEIRAIWGGYPVLFLKEVKGQYMLMDLGELNE